MTQEFGGNWSFNSTNTQAWQAQGERLLAMVSVLDAGIPVEALGRTILFGGFLEGKFTPDVAFIITEPVMKMLVAIGMNAGVEKIRFSLSDITNKKQMRDIAKIKMDNEDIEKSVQSVQKDIKKAGLMSKPEPEGEE